jgi:hypothetical protein
MTVRHISTRIYMCSVEAAQDLGPNGQVGEEEKCEVRTRSFDWRARLGDPPYYHGIWDVVSSTAASKKSGRTMAETYLSHAKTLLQHENLQSKKSASACLTLLGGEGLGCGL